MRAHSNQIACYLHPGISTTQLRRPFKRNTCYRDLLLLYYKIGRPNVKTERQLSRWGGLATGGPFRPAGGQGERMKKGLHRGEVQALKHSRSW